MLNLHSEFTNFNSNIKITNSKKISIIKSRDAVREKIRNYFKNELMINQPKFYIQGSFAIYTALNPLPGMEVDIDDGVYLQHIDLEENYISPQNAHNLIISALSNHTQDGCESKTSCVRVIYKKNYHLDIPIYLIKDVHALLAETKSNKWIYSDSKEFKNWFYNHRENEQSSRIIRYLKAWRDFNNYEFSSIELTILCINHYHNSESRDDLSIVNTLSNIISHLSVYRSIVKPVSPFEDLWADYSDTDCDKYISYLSELKKDINTAINCFSKDRATTILREIFGERFPKIDNDSNSYTKVETGAKPWGL
jgi:hypothetical protein